jgi:hypothetical protein
MISYQTNQDRLDQARGAYRATGQVPIGYTLADMGPAVPVAPAVKAALEQRKAG